MGFILALFKLLLPGLSKILDKFIPDADKRLEAKTEIFKSITGSLETHRMVLEAELKSDSWIQRNWRALTGWSISGMLIFLLFSNYVMRPYIWFFFGVEIPDIPIGKDIWELVIFCLGGYIATLDSLERVVRWLKL